MLIQKKCIGTVAYMGGLPALLEEFSFAFLQMALYSNEFLVHPSTEYIHYDRTQISYHAKGRNELVTTMKGDWIFMTDTDHKPEPDLLARMLNLFQTRKLDVLCGLYQVKIYPYPPLIYVWNEDKTEFRLISSFQNPDNLPLIQIDAAGAGCILIRRMVIYRMLEELKERPFDVTFQKEGKLPLSEDLSFFKRCDTLGIECYAAAKIENPHLIIAPLTMESCVTSEDSGYEIIEETGEGMK